MSETLTPPQNDPVESEDPFKVNFEMQDANLAARRLQLEGEEQAAAEAAAAKAKRGKVIENVVVGGIAAVTLGGTGVAFGHALGEHAENELKQNQQWQEEAEENKHRSDFENGIAPSESETPGPMNPAETPSPTEIPSPTQQSVDIQLPTLPSPEQK